MRTGSLALGAMLISGTVAALLTLAAAFNEANAQAPGRVYRIGFLMSGSSDSGLSPPARAAFRDALRDLGWVDGRNIAIDDRFADGKFDRLPELAAELVGRNVDVIVASPTPAAVAAKNATSTIPVVVVSVADPVAAGLVASLSRPGGNVTGVSYSVGSDLFGKQLELLKEAVPRMRRVAVLTNPDNPGHATLASTVKATAASLGLELQFVGARAPGEFESAFAAMDHHHAQGLLVAQDAAFGIYRERLAALAVKHRLPSVYGLGGNVEAGALMSYGPDFPHQMRQAAAYVDKLLKGAKPAELPVEQPRKFELVINLKTANALGLTLPPALVQRADRLIE